jgi:polyhydroxyalkanoate synthesis regulator phasin
MPSRRTARILADLEDNLVDEGLSEEQAEKLVNAIERKIDKALDEIDEESEAGVPDDSDEGTS